MDEVIRQYRRRTLWGPFAPIERDDLSQVEGAIGRPLPRQFSEFLLVANGGTLPYAIRLPPDDPDGRLISYDMHHAADTLAAEWRGFPSTYLAELLPPDLLPVARDAGGSQLFLDLRDQTHGQVWAFVHGLPEWAGGDGGDRGGVVSPDWDGYLAMLTIDEDYASDVWADARAGHDDAWTTAVIAWLDSGLPDWRSRGWA
jgi:hypothetical protein